MCIRFSKKIHLLQNMFNVYMLMKFRRGLCPTIDVCGLMIMMNNICTYMFRKHKIYLPILCFAEGNRSFKVETQSDSVS